MGSARRQDDDLLLGHPELAEQLRERLGLRLLVLEHVHHEHRRLPCPRVQRRLFRELPDLLRNAQAIVARMRPEHDAAVPPMRRARRALPRPTRALLAPGLLVTARDLAAGPGVVGALALV